MGRLYVEMGRLLFLRPSSRTRGVSVLGRQLINLREIGKRHAGLPREGSWPSRRFESPSAEQNPSLQERADDIGTKVEKSRDPRLLDAVLLATTQKRHRGESQFPTMT